MSAIAIIPARGGSRRLPRKNVLDFLGKPIISYTIEAALVSGLFDRVTVSTEDKEIAEISKQAGAEVYFRPGALATDGARVVDVCIDMLEAEIRQRRDYDILCCLYPTAPLRKSEDITGAFQLVESRESDFAMAVTEYYYSPHQALFFSASGFLEPMWPDMVNKRGEDVPRMLVDNGSTYVAWVEAFLKFKTFYGPKLKGYFMPRMRSVDIDVTEDFELAKLFAKRLQA